MKAKKILAVILLATMSLSVTSLAAEGLQKIEAYLSNDLSFVVDGQKWSPKDTDGSALTPILYKGRTYVPVRSLLEDKGVTVGFDGLTSTVSLDYSTIKLIDKTSPVLINYITGGGGAGKATFKEFTITKNRDFVESNIDFTQEYTFDLKDAAMLTLDGKPIEGKLEELIKASTKWSADSVVFEVDEITGAVTSAKIVGATVGTDSGNASALKVSVEIEISGPPFRIKITIRF